MYSQLLYCSSWWESTWTHGLHSCIIVFRIPEPKQTPTSRFTKINTSLLPQWLCFCRSLITDAERLNPLGISHCPRSLLHNTALMDEGNHRKHTSVYAALPPSLSDTLIYWTGASCHWWVVAAETVPLDGCRKPVGFTLGSCFTAATCWRCSPRHCELVGVL